MTKPKALTRQGILTALKQHQDMLMKYKVRRLGLFGSYATGKQGRRSDIDFLVEFEEPTFDNFMELSFYLEKLFRKKIELITPMGLSPFIKPHVQKEVRWHEVR